jgi:Bacterial transglutaminase-like N-terminal region
MEDCFNGAKVASRFRTLIGIAMPALTIKHITTYRYKQPVGFGEHRMMLRPRDGHDQQFPPGLGALSHPVDEADELLLALRRGPC